MAWDSFFENVGASVAAAAVIAAVALFVGWVRNLLLENQLKKAVDPNGIGIGYNPITHEASFTLQIHNYANATIRVRSIVFMAERFRIELEPEPKRLIYQTPLSNEMNHAKFGRKHLSKGSLEEDNNEHAMLLPAKTMAVWRVYPETIGQHEWKLTKIYVAFEYATIFGNSALIRMEVSKRAFESIKKSFEPLSYALHHKKPYDIMGDLRASVSKP